MRPRAPMIGTLLFFVSFAPGPLRATQPPEEPDRAAVLRVDEWGAPRWVKGSLGRLDLADLEGSAGPIVARLARDYFGATGEEVLSFDRLNRDTFGRAHLRFEQRLRGLRVVGAALVLHVDLAKGEAVGMHGRFAPELGWLPRTPDLAPEEALERAVSEAGLVEVEIADDQELVYFLAHDTEQPVLAWTATVRYSEGGVHLSDSLFADARTGALVGRHHHQAFAKRLETYDLKNTGQYFPNNPGELVASTNTGNPPQGTADAVAQAAHANAGRYYDALAGLFGRDSTDGQGEILTTVIHGVSLSGKNIFSADFQRPAVHMTDGDGTSYAVDAPTAFDLVAHEQSHILVNRAAGLIYDPDTASLHEALADVFAAATETYPNPNPTSGTWKLFEDVYTPKTPGDAARYMNDPVRDGASVDYWSEFSDSRKAHHNAGILNLAFVLLSQGGSHPRLVTHGTRVTVQGQTIRTAGAIFYNAMLSMVSDFEGFRDAAVEAAEAGFGAASPQLRATHDAFCEVGFSCDLEPPRQYVDSPSHGQVVSGDITIQGWATDASGVLGGSMRFKVDSQWVTPAGFNYGLGRSGVCQVHSDLNDPNCPWVGWQGTLDTTAYTRGWHDLVVYATDKHGRQSAFLRRFYVNNPPETATFPALADAWVNHRSENSNYGSATLLAVRSDATGSGKHTYLKFNVSGVSGSVTSAKLRIRTTGVDHPSSRVYHIANTSWGELSINWKNAPKAFVTQWQINALAAKTWHEIDVSRIVTGNGTYTIGLVGPDTPNLGFWSRETVHPPTLIVTYYP